MLILSRMKDQAIMIGDSIKVTVIKVQGNAIRIGIKAPEDIRILRGELSDWHRLSSDEKDPNELPGATC